MIDLPRPILCGGIINKVIHMLARHSASIWRPHVVRARDCARIHPAWPAAVLALAAGAAGASPDAPVVSPADVNGEDAAAYLEFEQVLDGKCYILSSGGKLVLMHNRHPERAIAYRLVRVFAGRPQGSFTVGRLDAGVDPIKLGCSEVDGRPQRWEVVRAEFEPAPETKPAPPEKKSGANDTKGNPDARNTP